MRNQYLYALAAGVQLICFVWFKNDPLFGDAISSTYYAANHIYEHNLLSIFYSPQVDPGHPTLYAWLLALCWKIFGQTLWVSHLFTSMWMLAFAVVFIRLGSNVLSTAINALAAITLLSFATYLSLSAMVLNTSMLMFLALLSVYAIVVENKKWLLVANTLMVCVHLQGTFFVVANAVILFLLHRDKSFTGLIHLVKKYAWVFLSPLLLFGLWLYLHYLHTGWWLQSPHYTDFENKKTGLSVLKTSLLIGWRLIDYGMLPVHVLAFWAVLKRKVAYQWSVIYCCYIAVNALLMLIFLQNTIAHRYFFVVHALGILLAYQYIATLKIKTQRIFTSLILLSTISGNFLYYPGKTLGDATLAYRSYFELEKRIMADLGSRYTLHSLAPIGNTTKSKYLSTKYPDIHRLQIDSINQAEVILQSNINAEYDAQTIDYLSNNWYGKSYEAGAVYVNVFLNPKKATSSPAGWKLRETGVLEKQINRLKKQFK